MTSFFGSQKQCSSPRFEYRILHHDTHQFLSREYAFSDPTSSGIPIAMRTFCAESREGITPSRIRGSADGVSKPIRGIGDHDGSRDRRRAAGFWRPRPGRPAGLGCHPETSRALSDAVGTASHLDGSPGPQAPSTDRGWRRWSPHHAVGSPTAQIWEGRNRGDVYGPSTPGRPVIRTVTESGVDDNLKHVSARGHITDG